MIFSAFSCWTPTYGRRWLKLAIGSHYVGGGGGSLQLGGRERAYIVCVGGGLCATPRLHRRPVYIGENTSGQRGELSRALNREGRGRRQGPLAPGAVYVARSRSIP